MKKNYALFMLCLIFFSSCREGEQKVSLNPSEATVSFIESDESFVMEEESGKSPFIRGLAKAKVASFIDPSMDDFEKVQILYKYLVEEVYFAEPMGLDMWYYLSDETAIPSYVDNRSISPLLYGIGSCEDYAAAMVLLLEEAGLSAEYVAGYTYSKEGDYRDHAWTVVEIQGNWYHLDPQLERNSVKNDEILYRYFLKTDNQLIVDHRWGENLIECWPEITEEDKINILENWTPPICDTERESTLREPILLSNPPNGNTLLDQIETQKRQSGKAPMDTDLLQIEPPVLLHNAPNNRLKLNYGRSFLSEEEQFFYDQLYNTTEKLEIENAITLPNTLSDEQAIKICENLKWDEPLFYWADFALEKSDTGERFLLASLKNGFSVDQIKKEKEEILQASEELIENIEGDPSFQLYFIHDQLASAIAYDRKESSSRSGDLYGALVQKQAICEGYARALQYMSQRAGIQSTFLIGKSHRGIAHAWNSVYLNEDWYYVDLTWDDADDTGTFYHDYLGIMLAEMEKEHLWDIGQYPSLPEANSNTENYFIKNGFVANAEQSVAEGFYNNALHKASTAEVGQEMYIEVHVDEKNLSYIKEKENFMAYPFTVLKEINKISTERGTTLQLQDTGDILVNYNNVTKTLVMRPILINK